MSERIEFPENTKKHQKQRDFRDKFPDKATVEARISAEINGAANIAQLKQAVIDLLVGNGNQPGLIDALFALDR